MQVRPSLRRGLAVVGISAIWLTTLASSALGQFPGNDGAIAFSGGEQRIQITDANGVPPITLRDGMIFPFYPRYSSDGSRIVFYAEVAGVSHIFTMKADGSRLRQLTRGARDDFKAAWSPDGRRIVFTRNFGGVENDLWMMSARGRNERPLVSGSGFDQNPSWSPDGEWIAYDSDGADTQEFNLWMVRPNGADAHQVTDVGPEGIFDPDWSPDGERLAVIYSTIADGAEIATVAKDGTGLQVLTDAPAPALGPSYSPSGTMIVYSVGSFVEDLWLMQADGSGNHLLLGSAERELTPGWQPL